MKCAKVKEFLMTDYFDGVASEETQKAIKEHLSACACCREIEQSLVKTRLSLQGAPRLEPPAEIWENIQSRILQESLSDRFGARGLFPRWLGRLFSPKPAFALATALVFMVVALNFVLFRRQIVNNSSGEEIAFLYRADYSDDAYNAGLGTDIEEYFL
jgi:hypothetical protein